FCEFDNNANQYFLFDLGDFPKPKFMDSLCRDARRASRNVVVRLRRTRAVRSPWIPLFLFPERTGTPPLNDCNLVIRNGRCLSASNIRCWLLGTRGRASHIENLISVILDAHPCVPTELSPRISSRGFLPAIISRT